LTAVRRAARQRGESLREILPGARFVEQRRAGSGLGLTIARQIARAHGGDVVYEPRAGGGSCFILRLPLQKALGQASCLSPF